MLRRRLARSTDKHTTTKNYGLVFLEKRERKVIAMPRIKYVVASIVEVCFM